MKMLELLPQKNRVWFSVIFQFADCTLVNKEVVSLNKKEIYVNSYFYETSKLVVTHNYKPIIII